MIYKRGKNYHPKHVPKNAKKSDYHEATAFEVLFGYLYLIGDNSRIDELFGIISDMLAI